MNDELGPLDLENTFVVAGLAADSGTIIGEDGVLPIVRFRLRGPDGRLSQDEFVFSSRTARTLATFLSESADELDGEWSGQGWSGVCAEKNCDEKATLGQTWRFDSGLRAEIYLCEKHFDMAKVLTGRTVTEEPA